MNEKLRFALADKVCHGLVQVGLVRWLETDVWPRGNGAFFDKGSVPTR